MQGEAWLPPRELERARQPVATRQSVRLGWRCICRQERMSIPPPPPSGPPDHAWKWCYASWRSSAAVAASEYTSHDGSLDSLRESVVVSWGMVSFARAPSRTWWWPIGISMLRGNLCPCLHVAWLVCCVRPSHIVPAPIYAHIPANHGHMHSAKAVFYAASTALCHCGNYVDSRS